MLVVNNMCDGIDKPLLVLLMEWADRLDADEMIIYPNSSITLLCDDGAICNHYSPTVMELLETK